MVLIMINLSTLKRQHEEIEEVVGKIKSAITDNKLELDANETAFMVSTLAGKLKIHLNTEDLYMYPDLLKSETEEVRSTAKAYMDEMGDISTVFMNFKNKFNTRSKISTNTEEFKSEALKVFSVLEKRILKEETSLYSYL